MNTYKKYVAEFVYGAIDGTVTTFAIMAGALGATLAPSIVLVLGCANLFADGFSMAVSNYLSRASEKHLSAGKEQVDFFGEKAPFFTAVATFLSFVSVGSVPLLPFVFSFAHPLIEENAFAFSGALTAITFIFIGWVRGRITKQNRVVTVLETLFIGGAAAVIAFGVGFLLRKVVGK